MKFDSLVYKAFFTLLIVFAFQYGISQTAGNVGIKTKFDTYRNAVLQEKIYAHTDKEVYLSGELLWFKLFYVDASFHQPLDVSKIAYVELLSSEHQPVLQAKISLSEGNGNGSLVLPSDLPIGNYTFRAYTNWMKNFDPEFYFEKEITVINTLVAEAASSQKQTAEQYDIQFFPEGGNLVSDLSSKLAFRAVNSFGKGIYFNGIIVNQNGDTIIRFQPQKFGIGSIEFTAKKGEEYEAIMHTEGNSLFRKKLPKALVEGYSLRVAKNENGAVRIKINGSEYVAGRPVYVLVHARQQIEESRQVVLNNGSTEFLIDEHNLVDGISQITVFDADQRPVCERLFFKRPTHQLTLTASANQQQYGSREKVSINVSTQEEGKPQAAIMSVAVYQTDSLTTNEDILSYLYLSSDLKGSIESPGYYFENKNPDTDQMLDNLMLTHGWRRFKWEDVLGDKKPLISFVPEYEGHIITAKVFHKKTGLTASNIQSFIGIPDSNFQFYTSRADSNGTASFFTKKFYGKHEIFAQAAASTENAYRVVVNSPFSETYSSRLASSFSYTGLSGYWLQAKSVSMQVQNVYTSEAMNQYKPLRLPSYAFYKPTRTYLLDDYTRFPTMEEVLREYVMEVVVNKHNNKLLLSLIRKDAAGIIDKHNPLVLVDGVPLLDNYNRMFNYDPLKVKELQIVNQPYFLGNAEFDGIVHFKTYKGYPDALPIDSNAIVVDYEGLQMQREFYSPVYETQLQKESRLPDFRTLLYWTPDFKTGQDGKGVLSFYTSDLPGKCVVVIQALSGNGKAGSGKTSFEVINPSFADKN